MSFQDNEVIEAKWVDIDEFIKMYKNYEIVPNIDFGMEEYEECLTIINRTKN